MPALSGIFVPNLVPLTGDGDVHHDELARHTDWLIARGISGLYPNGSTGEFLRFDEAEQAAILETVIRAAAGRVPVLAGAYGATVEQTARRCGAARDAGARAAAVVAPFYYKLSDESVYGYYSELARRSPIDLVLYNIPLFASPISVETVRRLAADCPRIIGIKDSSGDVAHMQRMLTAVRAERPDFAFLTGWDTVLSSMIALGTDGGTNASANVVPEVLVRIHELVTAGRLDEARPIQAVLTRLFDTMLEGHEFPNGFRAGVAARGFDVGRPRLPLAAIQQESLDRLSGQLPELLAPFDLR